MMPVKSALYQRFRRKSHRVEPFFTVFFDNQKLFKKDAFKT